MLKRSAGMEAMWISILLFSKCLLWNHLTFFGTATGARNWALNLRIQTEASQHLTTWDVKLTKPGSLEEDWFRCRPAHVSWVDINFMFSQWFTVSMLRSHLQRQIWLCETTTPRVPDAAVAILITHVALEATTDLPQITIRGVTNWHAMMTTTMKLQTGQLVSQVSVFTVFLNYMYISSNILPRAGISWDWRNQISLLFYEYGKTWNANTYSQQKDTIFVLNLITNSEPILRLRTR